ncbi:MAG: response regulator [Deltaproteobacteria bacterium]|jgi:putative two-component system response regulator|nr:response regulator [Deltaproteobacteria bacterium]
MMSDRSKLSIINSVIFVVDDNLTNLEIAKASLPKTYEVFLIQTAEKLFRLITRKAPDLILLDIDMPGIDGFEAIRILKADERTRQIPVIFLSGRTDVESLRTGLDLGGADFVIKPVQPKLLQKTVELQLTLRAQERLFEDQERLLEDNEKEMAAFEDDFDGLVENKSSQVLEQHGAILDTVSKLVEYRNDSNVGRKQRDHRGLAILIKALKERGLYADQIKDWDLELMLQSARLHDVGKLAISSGLLAKPGKLTSMEYEQVKQQPTLGVRILSRMESLAFDHALLKYAKVFAETHQEKWDGSGYPSGLAGEDIPLPGRLMAINVVYHALTAERPYKRALSHEEAVKVIIEGRGTHFDPILVGVFSEVADEFKRMSYSVAV